MPWAQEKCSPEVCLPSPHYLSHVISLILSPSLCLHYPTSLAVGSRQTVYSPGPENNKRFSVYFAFLNKVSLYRESQL